MREPRLLAKLADQCMHGKWDNLIERLLATKFEATYKLGEYNLQLIQVKTVCFISDRYWKLHQDTIQKPQIAYVVRLG